ncbi:MAG TPA: TolC family protein [Bryobacteraceae bacterium]|nr:TolC family protein [Bryobacteraceae bacterium]
MQRSVALLAVCLIGTFPALPQTSTVPGPSDTPKISTTGSPLTRPYHAPAVNEPHFQNSPRTYELIRAGTLYLSLQDAIALALENNLDIQLQRYTVPIAATDLKRAKGGGLLRGLVYSVNELPQGIGGPGSPLLTTVGGAAPATQISANAADLAVITESQSNLLINSPIPASTGTAIPAFDPALNGTAGYQHTSTIETSVFSQGVPNFVEGSENGTIGYSQGFSTGATVSATYDLSRNVTDALRYDYNPFLTASLGITVDQPLLRGFGIDLNRRFIHIAQNQVRISRLIFNQQLIDTISAVIRLYWDLVALNSDVRVKEEAVSAAKRLYEDNKSQVEVGTLAPLQLTQAAAEVARSNQDLINSQSLVAQQELILKNVLTKSGGGDPMLDSVHLMPIDTIQIPPAEDLPGVEQLIAEAFQNRPDLAQYQIQIANAGLQLNGSKNELLPQLDVIGSASNGAFAGTVNALAPPAGSVRAPIPPLIGGSGTLWEQILQRDYPNYSLGIQLTLPLRNRVAQADVTRDELQLRQSQVRLRQAQNEVRAEVQNALLAVQRARASYDAAVETRKLQEEALDAERERLAVGESTSFQVIQFQRDLEQARSSEVIAQDDYAKARAALDRSLGRTLTSNHILVDQAYTGVVTAPHSPLPAPK